MEGQVREQSPGMPVYKKRDGTRHLFSVGTQWRIAIRLNSAADGYLSSAGEWGKWKESIRKIIKRINPKRVRSCTRWEGRKAY